MAAEFDIFGGFVDKNALESFKQLEIQSERTAKNMKEIASQKDAIFGKVNAQQSKGGGSVGNTKEFDALVEANKRLTKSMQELQIQQQKVTAEMQKNVVTRQNSNATLKLQATLVSENSTALQKMYATMKLLEIEMQSKFNPALTEQSQEFRNLNAQHQKLQQEYSRTARATGVMGRSMNSTYGSTFQLTQVMRELPNFAIDARIGFMALSNNLPMLADSFKQLKQQIIDTEGAAGAGRKTWAAFGKSLLSLNTIMIVASTLLVLFGDDIVDFTTKLFKGADASEKFTESQKAIIKALGEQGGLAKSNTTKILELGVAIDKYKQGTGSAEKIVEQYNETLGVHYGKLNNINEVMAAYPQHASNYINWSIKMAASMLQVDEAAKLSIELQKINETLKATYSQDNINKVLALNAQIKNSLEGKDTKTGLLVQNKLSLEVQQRAKGDIRNYSEINSQLSKRLDLQSKIDKILKSATELYPGDFSTVADKTSGGGASKKQFTEINVRREYYQSESDLMKKLADLENDITKENEDGILNSYEKRSKAAKLYYSTIEQLAIQDRFVAVMNEKVKADTERRAIQQKYDNNVTKFGANSQEAIKSGGELETGKATIAANEKDALLKISDEYTKRILEASKKRSKDLLAIDKNLYEDEVYLLEQKEKRQLQFALQDTMSIGEMGLGTLGIKKDKSLDRGDKERSIKKNTLLSKLDKGAKGQEEKDIWRELELLKQEDADAAELKLLEAKEEAKASIVENSVNVLKSLWDSYYDYQIEKIDEQLEYQTAVNDEKVKQYEDEADAGKHSAKDVADYKANMLVYQTSQEEEAAKKKKQLEKEQFLLSQAMALATVWINYAATLASLPKASSSIVSQAGLVGIPIAEVYSAGTAAWVTGAAIAQSALIAAQTIPAFEDGGDVKESGISLVGEKRHELVYDRKTGKSFITPDSPTLMHLEKGMHVYPDINKLDLDSFNFSQMPKPMIHEDDRLLDEVKRLNKTLSKQKTPQINGMRLMQQLQMNQKVIGNRRGLL